MNQESHEPGGRPLVHQTPGSSSAMYVLHEPGADPPVHSLFHVLQGSEVFFSGPYLHDLGHIIYEDLTITDMSSV